MQQCRIKWGNTLSDSFQAQNGVKQGGVLSPILFTIYLDTLLEQLRQSGVGCHIGNVFTGALGYADDLVLLAPTSSGMRKLLNEYPMNITSFLMPAKASIYFLVNHILQLYHFN